MSGPEVLRYAAFTTDPSGGNPAGVVLDATGLDDVAMQAIAIDVGYSETAFVFPHASGPDGATPVRYFSVQGEVAFCGHATIATGVAWGERHGAGHLRFATRAGVVPVAITVDAGRVNASLTSVLPEVRSLPDADLEALLIALRYSRTDLEETFPAAVAYAGLWHPIVALRTRASLAALDYDFDALNELMAARGWTTAIVLWRESDTTFHVRNPFPPGGLVEDPATGSAAAALGGYLREHGFVRPPVQLTVFQGQDFGRPSVLSVAVRPAGGIAVSGTAVALG